MLSAVTTRGYYVGCAGTGNAPIFFATISVNSSRGQVAGGAVPGAAIADHRAGNGEIPPRVQAFPHRPGET
ncbi:hypothetical protein DFR50_11541 [Roseiarcus fermentans]|uniref:Uncharacterized protein n=1 Tax=Roseiarcus fermentans TaxID=1473586 RepID=A0A366FB81_9HYPH|nr:hypothetical protein DFR50_11541 [Roseiarcus fermentans]